MTFATTKSAVPGLSYRRDLADKVAEYREWNLHRLAKASLDDPDFCPAMPESDRKHAAKRQAQRSITVLTGVTP